MQEEDREPRPERGDGTATSGGWDGVERRQPEKTFLDQPGLFVSSRRVVVEGNSHPLTRTTSARVHRTTQDYATETTASSFSKPLLVLGLVVAAIMGFVGGDFEATPFGVRLLRMLPGLIMVLVGWFLGRQQLKRTVIRYNAILYDHAHADVTLASSTNEPYIGKIVNAIKEAEATIRDWQQGQNQVALKGEALEEANREARERAERLMRRSQEDEAARAAGADD